MARRISRRASHACARKQASNDAQRRGAHTNNLLPAIPNPKDSINHEALMTSFARAIMCIRIASQSSRMQHLDPRKLTAKRKLLNE
jgi:hypothetical protein